MRVSNNSPQRQSRRRIVSRPLALSSVLLMVLAAFLVMTAGSTSAFRRQGSGSRGQFQPQTGIKSLDGALSADGTVKPGATGSFDVSGFHMEYAANGAPRFIPAPLPSSNCSYQWDTQFGLPQGQVVDNAVTALAVSGSNLYLGGTFTIAGSVIANGVAKFDTVTKTWSAKRKWRPPFSGKRFGYRSGTCFKWKRPLCRRRIRHS